MKNRKGIDLINIIFEATNKTRKEKSTSDIYTYIKKENQEKMNKMRRKCPPADNNLEYKINLSSKY